MTYGKHKTANATTNVKRVTDNRLHEIYVAKLIKYAGVALCATFCECRLTFKYHIGGRSMYNNFLLCPTSVSVRTSAFPTSLCDCIAQLGVICFDNVVRVRVNNIQKT